MKLWKLILFKNLHLFALKKKANYPTSRSETQKFTLAKENLGFRPPEVYQSFGITAKAVIEAKSLNV